jgi:hypothetical protein
MEQQIPESLIRKIQLLLNLGERSHGNENEAAAAMAKAQDLLAQYNLDLATVKDKVVAGGTAEREAESKRDYTVIKRSAMYKWQQKLMRTLSEANYCVYWTHEVKEELYYTPEKRERMMLEEDKKTVSRWVKRHRVLGRLVNTTAVLVMADYLFDAIERLVPYAQKDRLSREANIWREGCVDRLCERIQEKAERMREADYAKDGEKAYSTAIMVKRMDEAEEIANYDHQWGAGAWARQQAKNAQWNADYREREAKQAAEQKALLASETPEAKAKRLAEEAKQAAKDQKYWDRVRARYQRESDKQETRRNSAAYRTGRHTGNDIGLDGQLGKGKSTERLSK